MILLEYKAAFVEKPVMKKIFHAKISSSHSKSLATPHLRGPLL